MTYTYLCQRSSLPIRDAIHKALCYRNIRVLAFAWYLYANALGPLGNRLIAHLRLGMLYRSMYLCVMMLPARRCEKCTNDLVRLLPASW
jgi:hypothetical protein